MSLDVPEEPLFASLATERSFPENTPPGRAIGLPVTASDGDGDALTYSLEGSGCDFVRHRRCRPDNCWTRSGV